MIALGCYFIYQGEVVQKYKSKMTNFALSEENIAELPTIKTWISPLTSQFKLGKDFNITYKSGTEASEMKPVNLSLGNNSIDGDLTVNFQRLQGRNSYSKLLLPSFHLKCLWIMSWFGNSRMKIR